LDDSRGYQASHAWAEAFVHDLGWVGFDPANRICPTEAYIRTSIGLDYWSAAPVRGLRRGVAEESLAVTVTVQRAGAEQ
jgi:transglutaminase-like putative cysteine protease